MKRIETDADWLACTDPTPMVNFLRGKASDRKLRLFLCACCRSVWHLLHKRVRKGVTITECFVDGTATASKLEQALEGMNQNTYWLAIPKNLSPASELAARCATEAVLYAAKNVYANMCLRMVVEARLTEDEEQDPLTVRIELSRLLLDVVGNPFRPVAVSPFWLTNKAVELARTIYDERAIDRLPELADALERAGCTNADILAHCRSEGPHVRGCWVVDLLLGKE
jgi:hypothetical protein